MNKICDLKPGNDSVVIEALINHVVTGKTNGANRSTYLSIVLQDDSGTIDAKLWNATELQVETLTVGTIVQVKGDVIKYNDDRQMKIIKIVVASNDEKDKIKYLKQAPVDSSKMMHDIRNYVDQINKLKLNQLVKALFEENFDKL